MNNNNTLCRREAIARLGATAVALLTTSSLRAQTPVQADKDLWFVAPDLREAAAQLQSMTGSMPQFSAQGLPALRKGGAWKQPPLSTVPWEKRVIKGTRGNPDVTIYIINANPGRSHGGIVHMHGGGFVTGSAADEIRRSQELAAALDCTIVSVEYRLAPETSYKGSLEDNYAALVWTHRNAAEIGMDPARIALLGESAGGGHAALLAIAARDRGEVRVAFQCLVYPMLDDRTASSRPVPRNIGTLLWTPPANRFGWRSFLGREPGGAAMVAGVPGREPNLAGLPPTWIGVGGIDLFVQEDLAFAKRLVEASVPTEVLVIPGAFHGFDLLGANTVSGQRFTTAKIDALRRALHSPAQL